MQQKHMQLKTFEALSSIFNHAVPLKPAKNMASIDFLNLSAPSYGIDNTFKGAYTLTLSNVEY